MFLSPVLHAMHHCLRNNELYDAINIHSLYTCAQLIHTHTHTHTHTHAHTHTPHHTHTHTHTHTSTELTITIPSFSGSSYIVYPPITGATQSLTITLIFNPSAPTGLLLFSSLTNTDFSDYFFVALVDGFVQFGFNLGSGGIVISSTGPLQLDTFHTVTVSRNGANGTLYVDDSNPVFGSSPSPFTGLSLRNNLYLGGHETFINVSSIAGTSEGFTGCIESLIINNQDVDLILGAEFGFGIGNCNVSLCRGSPCLNGGTCTETGSSFVCQCSEGYTGPLCGSLGDPCDASTCSEGSTCQPSTDGLTFTCLCPLGRGGDNCDQGGPSTAVVYLAQHSS